MPTPSLSQPRSGGGRGRFRPRPPARPARLLRGEGGDKPNKPFALTELLTCGRGEGRGGARAAVAVMRPAAGASRAEQSECRWAMEETPVLVAESASITTSSCSDGLLAEPLGQSGSCHLAKENLAQDSSPTIKAEKKCFQECSLQTLDGYRAMTRRRIGSPTPSITFYVKDLKKAERERILRKVATLSDDANCQKSVLAQVSKALSYCCAAERRGSRCERVECERLLLTAQHRYRCTTKKIELLKNDIKNGCILHLECGMVKMSNISLSFSPSLRSSHNNEEFEGWAMCLLSHEETVLATEAKLLDKELPIQFQKDFTFTNLLSDFAICVQLFTLSLRKGRAAFSRHRFKKFLPALSTCSVRMQPNSGFVNSSILGRQAIFRTSDFELKGSFTININNLKPLFIWNEPSQAQVNLSLSWDVVSRVEASGFLTVGEDLQGCRVWERRWCYLEACVLKCWNYPADRELVSPLKMLDLRCCINTSVEPLDKSLCSRTRTFALEFALTTADDDILYKERNNTIYLFATDNKTDLLQWCMVFTKNLELIRKWKMI